MALAELPADTQLQFNLFSENKTPFVMNKLTINAPNDSLPKVIILTN